jgi:MFS family permease
LFVAAILVGVGECFHTTLLMPLVADLAPADLRGRYMASTGLSWWIGLAIAPVFGAPLLNVSPTAVFLTAAVVALLGQSFGTDPREPAATRLPADAPPARYIAVTDSSGANLRAAVLEHRIHDDRKAGIDRGLQDGGVQARRNLDTWPSHANTSSV